MQINKTLPPRNSNVGPDAQVPPLIEGLGTPNLFGFAGASRYPQRPGHRRPLGGRLDSTSAAAARAIEPAAASLRRQSLSVIVNAGPQGLTSDEVAAKLGKNPLAIRPRVTELLATGYVIPTGNRRPNNTGKLACAVRASAKGVATIAGVAA